MTSKERMLCAIKKETPDRLPVTIHQWQPYHLKKYMLEVDDIEANKVCGLDASINFFEIGEEESPLWKIDKTISKADGYYVTNYTITTPEGILTTSEGSNAMTTWVMTHLIKKEEDIHLLSKYRPIPKLNQKKAIDIYDRLGNDGILRTFVWGKQGGCWQDACELFGVENLILATYDDPQWVHEFLQILLHQKKIYIEESLRGMPFDLIETGGGASSNTVISPNIHKEFCLPYDKEMHKIIHDIGQMAVYHTCGGMTKILDSIIENGCDVSETLSPTGVGGDIQTAEHANNVYKTLHGKVGLIGGMDQFHVLEKGTKEEIEKEVEKLFYYYGQEGGYIMSACDHFFEVPCENLKIFAKAAKKYMY